MGPGSPSYAVRQLRDSLAWYALLASHRLGATIVFASAATVSTSLYAIPVYEIYKVGEDLHWKDGLDFFGQYGLPLVFVPHWNNNDGGEELDTSRCFMGQSRFSELMEMIPSELTVLGIDEKTALVMDPQACTCRVIGQGGVTILHAGPAHRSATALKSLNGTGLHEVAQLRRGHVHQYLNGQFFSLSRIGPFRDPQAGEGLPPEVWQQALEVRQMKTTSEVQHPLDVIPPAEVLSLVDERQDARARKDWSAADHVRQQIAALGWQVQDTPGGPKVVRSEG